jgi:hypothetical protein
VSKYEQDANRAKDVLERHKDQIRQKYRVDGTGVGFKIENGKLTDKIALQFYVKKKKSKDQLLYEGITPIPDEIEGFPTDVTEIPGGFKPRT